MRNTHKNIEAKVVEIQTGKIHKTLPIKHGSMLIFSPECQKRFRLEIPEATFNNPLAVIFRQNHAGDIGNVGKTPSFGGINLITPTNLFGNGAANKFG